MALKKLPKNPKKGKIYELKTKRGIKRFKCMQEKPGFGMWRIVK